MFNLLVNTTCAGHYSLGNVREVMKHAAKNCSLNYYKMRRTTVNWREKHYSLVWYINVTLNAVYESK